MNLLFKTTFYLPETRLKPTEISKRTKTSKLEKKTLQGKYINHCVDFPVYRNFIMKNQHKSTSYIN